MKKLHSCLFLLFIVIFFISCEKNTSSDKPLTLSGQLIKSSACKSNLKSAYINDAIPDSLSCVEYSFDAEKNKLTIKHINAGFNCCPDSIYCKIDLNNDTIFIKEFEKMFLCDCNCLYDLDINIDGVENKKYQLKFEEPYALDQNKFIFNIDLQKNPNGTYCVTRKQYPWGMNSLNN